MRDFKGFKTISRTMLMAVSLGMFISAPSASAADVAGKIGVVDYGRIFQQMPETKSAEQAMLTARNQTSNELNKLQTALQNDVQNYLKLKQKNGKGEPAKEKELQGREEKLRKLAAEKQTGLVKKEQELVAPIRQKIDGAVESIAKKDGYSMIFDRNVRVYGDAQSDITFKVLDQLNIK
ncbi:MAG: OmpH family outer membrane protein [Chlorobiaceae bacterium]|nr:OmpH family outer membrane protein [Chlorobiaceae bacterium]